jgi:hypothetical protein
MRGIQMRLNDLVEAVCHDPSVPRGRNARPPTAPVQDPYGTVVPRPAMTSDPINR